jgi:O-antigen ligase
MFAFPGLAALLLLILIKPQEFIPGLEAFPLLYGFLGLTLLGLVIDLKLGLTRLDPPPQWPYIAFFVPWSLGSLVANAGAGPLTKAAIDLIIVVVLFFMLSLGQRSFRVFDTVSGALVLASMFVAGVCFHQGFAPLGCAIQSGSEQESLRADGRPCINEDECLLGDAEPGANYRCERSGLFDTVSVGRGRVRYRGVLKDPNEVSLTIGAALPWLVVRVARKQSIGRILTLIVALGVVATTIIFTQSRGGILVLLAVIATYSIQKFGWKGALVGGILGAPMLLLGGRSGDEAKASSDERTEILVEGLNMVQSRPIYGVGWGQFTQHHSLTAHNSYLLALAELGIVGLIVFGFILYISLKIPILGMRRYANRPEAKVAYTSCLGMLASFAGIAIGAFFLSFTYHQVLWIYFGFSGGLYATIRRHDPTFEIKLSLAEKAAVTTVCLLFPVMLRVLLKSKGH